jgi:hypothetical protein
MLAVARRRSGAKIQMPSGSAITIANAEDDERYPHPEQVPTPEDHCSQDDDKQQPGQNVEQHVNHEAGSGARLRHGPSLPTARIFRSRRFCVAYLLLVLVLAGLIYVGWRLTRATASRPKTRTIGPDDDPDFLRRLGHGDSPRS